jgi:cytochrome c-type biogenesis protein CcmF
MVIGSVLVKLAFVTCLLSVLAYVQHHRRGDTPSLRLGRRMFHTTAVVVILLSALQLYHVLTHRFDITYIWSYSSRDLPTPLLISTFYAGQEGSFMLWTLFTALIGVFLLQDSARKGYEPQVMAVYGTIQMALLLFMVAKDPFMFVWETWRGQVEAGFTPSDGRGLNPLLQNYWMVIHPQVLFAGFAAMGVPYAYAGAALLKRDYRNWIRPATPWLVFAALSLGTGIMMGGYWAYETLGWGGYWAWDPVENSSLVPWLISVATIHTVLSQRKSGAFVRTNLILGMLCYLAVLYSTFLTRSGVLGETSVHSFVEPGALVYWLLVGAILLFAGIGAGLLWSRRKDLPRAPVRHGVNSREFALFLGSASLVILAILVTVGTSSPLITGILQGKKSAVDISYYATTAVPLGIAIALLAGIGQLLWWTRSSKEEMVRGLLWPFLFAAACTAGLFAIGVEDIQIALFVFGSAFALLANILVGIRIVRGNPRYAGGAVAHVGLALMFFGFVASSVYDARETVSLRQGEPTEVLGYTLVYSGYGPLDGERFAFNVEVQGKGRRFTLAPVMYFSKFNDGLMRNPDIANLITKDFYLAPLSLETPEQAAGVKGTVRKGGTATVGDLSITFEDFDLSEKADLMEGKEAKIGARLRVKGPEGREESVTAFRVVGGSDRSIPATYPGGYSIELVGMNPDGENPSASTVDVSVSKAGAATAGPAKETLVVEASLKPYINLVWSGFIILTVGFLVTIFRRSGEASGKAAA